MPVTVTGPQAKPPQKRERMLERFCSIRALMDAMAVAFLCGLMVDFQHVDEMTTC